MKKSIILGISAFILFCTLSSCTKKAGTNSEAGQSTASNSAASNNDLLSQIKSKGELTIATEGTWAPWTFHDESDKLVGFDIEVAQKIAEKLGVKANFVEVEWDGIFAGIDSKRYDLTANGVEITEERSQKYDFTEPYGYIHTAIIVRGDNNSINSFEDLKGKQTANTLASTYALLAESYGATAVGVDDLNQTLQLVLAGRVDATLNADVSFYDYMKVHPEANLKIVAVTKDASQVSIPLRKDGTTENLKKEIDAAIKSLHSDGTLSAISVKYFGNDITRKN